MKYLIFVETGGDMECHTLNYMYYTICEGETEEEALNDWAEKNGIDYARFYTYCGRWVDRGYNMQIVPLHDVEPDRPRRRLEWVK